MSKAWKIVFLSLLSIVVISLLYLSTFKLKEVEVSGCEVVNEQDVLDAISNYTKSDNTVLIYLKNKIKPIESLRFVAKMHIEIVSRNKLSVTVYEKSIAGCVEYMDQFIYFDKDGIILDALDHRIDGIPRVEGLVFDQWEIGQKLPIEDKGKFQMILSVTQLLDKYELDVDSIEFTAENEIVLTHEGIIILLGEGEYLAIQMMNLGSILEGLEGMEGTLYMKDFNSDNATASFSRKKY